MKIGFIGTGMMGSRMVLKFLERGHEVVVFNRTAAKVAPLVERGATAIREIASLAREVDVVCTCLSMPQDVREVYLGEEGILQNAKPKTVCVDFTTIDVETSKSIEMEALTYQIGYLDAPVSGGPEGVEQGSLTIMVGGTKAHFDTVSPLLQILGDMVMYLGPSGSGSIAKLINQYLVAVHSVAASEAMVAGVSLGLDSVQLYQLLKVSYGDSKMLRRHMEGFVLERQFEPGGAVKYVHKDVVLANKLFSEVGMARFLGRQAEQSYREAMTQGLGEFDMSAIILPLEQECGVEVQRKKD